MFSKALFEEVEEKKAELKKRGKKEEREKDCKVKKKANLNKKGKLCVKPNICDFLRFIELNKKRKGIKKSLSSIFSFIRLRPLETVLYKKEPRNGLPSKQEEITKTIYLFPKLIAF